ncbi:hypothetical protein AMTR_s00058p00143650 [Amborella trichopoda]|uniref:3-deoxy-manno-octulosonate cytidylyltransferase n=1 Tax=Amborella trichopoda TaxID=13333 RepID=W1PG18_AMBTC|nr:hypothetical protein AMTR_s00058p00143650 [Amborella trichopoda]
MLSRIWSRCDYDIRIMPKRLAILFCLVRILAEYSFAFVVMGCSNLQALSVAMKLSRSSRKNMILPEIIDGVIKALQRAPDAVFSTAVTSLKPEDAFDPNWVKCVVDKHGYAIYFSRSLLPCNKSGEVNPKFPYLLHLGIQSYDSNFLKIYPQLLPTPLQLEEDLEQLKVLENGYKMKVIKVDHDAHCVDTPADVEKIGALMWERNISCRHASRCGKDGSSDVGKKIS